MILFGMIGASANVVAPCSVDELRQSPGYMWRIERVGEYVDVAKRIIRARAKRADSLTQTVTFEPVEWIRGNPDPVESLVLPGVIVEHDDYNHTPVPYQTVRQSGQFGSCFAEEYRLGQQYLLLLQDGIGQGAIKWWPLGPVNEQLRGDNDPWLHWVRQRVAAQSSRRVTPNK